MSKSSTAVYTTELHLHTCYSFLEGASQPEELALRAAELGYQALAITDHDGLYGAMAFAQACAAYDIRPITGVELTLRHGLVDEASGPVHLTLLAESDRGYANLCRLITKGLGSGDWGIGNREWGLGNREWGMGRRGNGKAESGGEENGLQEEGERSSGGVRRPSLPIPNPYSPIPPLSPIPPPQSLIPALLEGHTEGLIVLTGCRSGEVARLVDAGRFDEAEAALRALVRLFGPHSTFVEVQQNLVRGDTRRLACLAELAERVQLSVVATGNVHYHRRERHRLQDAMVAIKHRGTLESSHRQRRPNSEFYLRAPEEVAALFAAYPEALANAALIGERCRDFNLADRRELGYEFPDFARQADEAGASADEVLASYCSARFEERYPVADIDPALREKARAQLAAELKLTAKHHLAGFFLIYRDLQLLATEVARDVRGVGTIRGGSGLPPGRGRGSSVSSIICYLIGLSHVDPVANRLFFRRFLNEDLQAVPDIDLDFARDIREALILRVYERYGHDHAALVCAFATYHLRSAVRDLGKVLGLPPAAIDKLARLAEARKASGVRRELERLPGFQGQASGPLWQHLADLAEEIDGFPRHVSQHVGGMIISSRPLVELVPVQPASMPGRFICQWDKDSCDDARFIKIDFLALGMLSLVEECLELIWQTRGRPVDLGHISYDDPAVYDAIARGDTVGVFQVESRAQIQMLTRTQPRNLDDLAVQVAIVRPGPIVGGAVNPYVRRREQQRRDPRYVPRADHPLLDDLLRDTLGVVIYQDQVLEVVIELGGFTPGQADQFRRAMSRRRSLEAMEQFRERFIRGARERSVSEQDATAIFERLRGFSEFGFPKSHAYAFAVLAYQSAWLRHYYPAEYYAALFNNQPMGFYPPHVLVGDARRHGLHVFRVSLNRSTARCLPLPPVGSRQGVQKAAPQPSPPWRAQASDLPSSPRGDRGAAPPEERFSSIPPRSPAGERGPGGEGGALLLGLTTVRGVSEDLAQAIVAEREAHGPYRSLADLLRRASLPRSIVERLIAVGALGDFGLGRRELLWQLGLLAPASQPRTDRRQLTAPPRQQALDLPTEQDMVRLRDLDDWERMVADYGLLGLSPSYHPMGLLRPRLPGTLVPSRQLRSRPDGVRVRTAGLVVCRQRPGTAKGFVFLLLEDETGLTNVVVRPDLYDSCRSVVRGEPYLCIEGRVQVRSGTLNLLAERIWPLANVPDALLPQPHGGPVEPDNTDDPHGQADFQRVRDYPFSPRPPASTDALAPLALRHATPPSHDFH